MADTLRVLVAHVALTDATNQVVGYCLDPDSAKPMIVTLAVDPELAHDLESRWLPHRGSFFTDFLPSQVLKLQELQPTTGAYADVKKALQEDAQALQRLSALEDIPLL